jgi:DNA-binding NarL/FixJ family response regulator
VVTSHPLTVAIVSRHQLTRAGLTQLLAGHGDRAVVRDVTDRDGQLGHHDVVVYDLAGLIDTRENDLTHLLAAGMPVVALEPHGRVDLGEGALASGVALVVSMDLTSATLLEAIEQAVAGGTIGIDQRRAQHRAAVQKAVGLSGREIDVLELIASGAGNLAIAEQLHLSINSIKTYIRTSYRKIGVTSRPQAVLWAVRRGLVAQQDHAPGSGPSRPSDSL